MPRENARIHQSQKKTRSALSLALHRNPSSSPFSFSTHPRRQVDAPVLLRVAPRCMVLEKSQSGRQTPSIKSSGIGPQSHAPAASIPAFANASCAQRIADTASANPANRNHPIVRNNASIAATRGDALRALAHRQAFERSSRRRPAAGTQFGCVEAGEPHFNPGDWIA